MSDFIVDFPDDFMADLLRSDFDEIAAEACEEAAPELKATMSAAIRSVMVSKHADSELINSIKVSKPKKAKNGATIVNVGPSGTSKNYYRAGSKRERLPVTNVMKAVWLEHGRQGQPARPFLATATNNAREIIMKKMQEIYDRKVGAK